MANSTVTPRPMPGSSRPSPLSLSTSVPSSATDVSLPFDYFALPANDPPASLVASPTSYISSTPPSSVSTVSTPGRWPSSTSLSSSPRTWGYSGRERATPQISPASTSVASPMPQSMSLPLAPGVSAMSEVQSSQKQPSLMRRVSQKAANKLRRRTSSTSHDPDERGGPVLMRHRSGSMGGGVDAVRLGIQQVDVSDDEDQVAVAELDQVDGEGSGKENRIPTASGNTPDGIIVPDSLLMGTTMLRVTRKKKTHRMFRLDINTARVSWDPSKPSSRFYVDDIKEIRTGADARNYREEFQISSDCEERWATIQYADPEDSTKFKTLHLIAPTVDLFHQWTTTLEKIHRYRTEMMAGLAMQGEKYVEAHWRNFMASAHASNPQQAKDEKLSFEDVERLCRRLHVNCSRKFLKEKFKRADRDNSSYLNFLEFRRFVKLLKEREEIKAIWKEAVVNPDMGMYRHEFRGFLRDVQKVDLDADSTYVDKVFRKYCRQSFKAQRANPSQQPPEDLHEMRMSMEAFSDYLLSSTYNPPLITATNDQELRRPLNEYFISSSHNTYLMGRQVRGESSVEGYIRVLQRGCRCAEIDCWDGDDGRPVVTHGRTGTSEVLFSDVVSAVGKYAFMASPYPLILSLEVHCCLEQQVKMAEILTSTLGEKLVTKPFMTNSFILPSPYDLKHRILIKVKGSERTETTTLGETEKRSGSASASSSVVSSFNNGKGQSSSSTNSTSDSDSESGAGDRNKPKQRIAKKIAPELGSLAVYCRGEKFHNFALPESKTFNHVFSFQEKSFTKFCKDPERKASLEKHNVRYLMRLYPSGFRVNSSNFDPLGFWRRGVQMVALNWQTYDLGMQINDAMFASGNDRCGYVLKPKELRGPSTAFDLPADAAKAKKEKKEVKFSIEVISAQQLSRPKDRKFDDPIDPFVEVEVFSVDDKTKGASTSEGGLDTSVSKGTSGLGAPQKRRTKVVKDDGFHPLFREKMTFSLVTKFESLVFVRFSVFAADGIDATDPNKSSKQLIAIFTAKLMSLQQGYRHLPLYDLQGDQFLFSTLFVKIEVDPVIIIDREFPSKTSTMESIRSTARSMFNRSVSVRRIKNKSSPEKKEKRHSRSFSKERGQGSDSKEKEQEDAKRNAHDNDGVIDKRHD